jgi:hypothetical protein
MRIKILSILRNKLIVAMPYAQNASSGFEEHRCVRSKNTDEFFSSFGSDNTQHSPFSTLKRLDILRYSLTFFGNAKLPLIRHGGAPPEAAAYIANGGKGASAPINNIR